MRSYKHSLNEAIAQYQLVLSKENEQFGDSEEIHAKGTNIRELTQSMYDELAETFNELYFELTHGDNDEDYEFNNIDKSNTNAVIRFIKKYYTEPSEYGYQYVEFRKNGCTLYDYKGLSFSWDIKKVETRKNNIRNKKINIFNNSDITSMFNVVPTEIGNVIILLYPNNDAIDDWIKEFVDFGNEPCIEIEKINNKFSATAVTYGGSTGTKYTREIEKIKPTRILSKFIDELIKFFMEVVNGEHEITQEDKKNNKNNLKMIQDFADYCKAAGLGGAQLQKVVNAYKKQLGF